MKKTTKESKENTTLTGSAKEQVKLLFSELRFDDKTHLGLGDIRLTIGVQERIIKIIDKYEKEMETKYNELKTLMNEQF